MNRYGARGEKIIYTEPFVSNNRDFTLCQYEEDYWVYALGDSYTEVAFESKEEAIKHIESLIYIDDVPDYFTVGSEWWVSVLLNRKPIITKAEIFDITTIFCENYLGLQVTYTFGSEYRKFYNIDFERVCEGYWAKDRKTPIVELSDFFKSNPEDFIVP
jgi:hypothetical protein